MVEHAVPRLITMLFQLTLEPPSDGDNYQYLPELAQELIDEGSDLQLSRDKIDRLLTAKLMLEKTGQNKQWTIDYLLGVYARSKRHQQSIQSLKNRPESKEVVEEMEAVCALAQQLAISNVVTQLNYDIFPQNPEEKEVGARALLWAIEPSLCTNNSRLAMLDYNPVNGMPDGFMKSLAEQSESDGLPPILESICGLFVDTFREFSILADFQRPIQVLHDLIAIPSIARCMTKLERWKAHAQNGRAFAETSILGSMFCISGLPDFDLYQGHRGMLSKRLPNVSENLFPQGTKGAQASNGIFAIRSSVANLRGMLKAIIMVFLKPNRYRCYMTVQGFPIAFVFNEESEDTREAMLDWFATALELNNEFDKEMVNAAIAAPRGFMSNLSAILLELCGPFLDFTNGKAKGKIDAWYCLRSTRMNYSNATRLHMTPDEETAQLERLDSRGAAASSTASPQAPTQPPKQSGVFKPHFICECYFMALKALHLGYIGLSKMQDSINEQARRLESELNGAREELEGMGETLPQDPTAAMRRMQVRAIKNWQSQLFGIAYCLNAELGEDNMVDNISAFYRLTAVWLLMQVSPTYAQTGQLQLPLPAEAPVSFTALPEYIFSDLADFFKKSPGWLDHQQLTRSTSQLVEVVMCCVAFMPASSYINNIYLRAQLAELLQSFMPHKTSAGGLWGRSQRTGGAPGTEIETLLATSEVIKSNLVKGLLQLFVEVERTGRHNQFYEKFYIRWDLGRLLKHLWQDTAHREEWLRLSELEGDLYSRFNYFLETDATLHLDDALKALQEIRDYQNLPEEQRQDPEHQREHERREGTAKFHLQHAKLLLKIINMTVPVIWKPWMQEQAIKRIAGTLNYFLKYLTGPERQKLAVKDAARVDFDPKEFLTLIASVYIHFARKAQGDAFAQAIAADKRSYYDQMFVKPAAVLRQFQLMPEDDIRQLDSLAEQTAQTLKMLEAEDAAEAEAPEEFFDPILGNIMSDPVTLPSGVDVERENILRHLMSDPTDPYSRVPLAAADLKPNLELKERIQQWRQKSLQSSATPMTS